MFPWPGRKIVYRKRLLLSFVVIIFKSTTKRNIRWADFSGNFSASLAIFKRRADLILIADDYLLTQPLLIANNDIYRRNYLI